MLYANFKYFVLDSSQQMIVKNLIDILINNNLFFKLIHEHAILYEFLKKIYDSPKLGEDSMNQIYQKVIMKSFSKIYTCYVTVKIASAIGIEINTT